MDEPEGLTLFESLDDAAAYLRNDGMVNLARCVERAATLLGERPDPDARPLRPTLGTEVIDPLRLGLGADTVRELDVAKQLLERLANHCPPDSEDWPRWQSVADSAHRALSAMPASRRALAAAFDALSMLRAMTMPDEITKLVAATIDAMPRAAFMFGDGANVAPDDDAR